jgi:hypothetical protein
LHPLDRHFGPALQQVGRDALEPADRPKQVRSQSKREQIGKPNGASICSRPSASSRTDGKHR